MILLLILFGVLIDEFLFLLDWHPTKFQGILFNVEFTCYLRQTAVNSMTVEVSF